jgi:Uma2 family endonuclease
MNIRAKLAPEQQLTIKEFLAFTATRPDGERWELIEGAAVLNPSPVGVHQLVCMNIGTYLMMHKRKVGAPWIPLLGIGTRVPISPNSLPQPDVFVQDGPAGDTPVTDDALIIFEVLSRSNTKADQAWRRRVYASVPNCQHYVTVSLKAVEVTLHSRRAGWEGEPLESLGDRLDLPAIGVAVPLAEIYRDTPLGGTLAPVKPRRKRPSRRKR